MRHMLFPPIHGHKHGEPDMNINIWTLKDLSHEEKVRILKRAEADIEDVSDIVRPILEDVKKRGDDALIDYARKFDKADVSTGLKATKTDFAKAYKALDNDLIEAIKICAENVRTHHQQQMDRIDLQWLEEVQPGQFAGEKITPIPSVGLYVPRGKGAFPSAMYMLCIPAKIAGVENIAVCTPPKPEGDFDAASLVAADICGVRDVYKVGGAQAIAALAYGTETVPKVVKVEGPGSPYVSAAKRLLSDIIHPGMPAGSSESLVLADDTADPWNTALDMVSEAEHGSDSASVLVTTSRLLADKVTKHLEEIIYSLPEERQRYCEDVFANYGGIIICDTMDEAIAFTNEYAAEHMQIKTGNPEAILERIINAGEIVIGETTTFVMGSYGIGINHVLPTGQKALSYDCTSVWSFLKRSSLSYITPEAYQNLKNPVTTIARYEGFDGHAKVITDRNEKAFSKINLKKVS